MTAFDCQASPVDRQCQPLYLDRIRADRSSTRSGDGKGSVDVKVAVFEGGVAADVPDLNVPGGVDCLSGSPVVPGLSLEDHNGHGSLVAGIVGARDDGQGLVRVAPGTPLWSVRVADDAGVITATAIADYDGKPGGKAVPPICYGRDDGFWGEADDLASLEFSNFARSATDRRHTLAAPGVCMESNFPLPAHHAVALGTSLASPVVAGVLALCVHTHRCGASTPARNLRTLVNDAHAYNERRPGYGFFGDLHRPIPGRHYGPLIAADRY